MQEIVRILHALGDALERKKRAKIIVGEKRAELFLADLGINGH
jgi:hypothetical protein